MRTLRQRLSDWLRNLLATTPRIERKYEHQFCDLRRATITLSNYRPRYRCEHSEPFAVWLRPEFEQWRSECLAEFQRETGTKITPAELQNEREHPLPPGTFAPEQPYSPSRHAYDQRHGRGEDRSFRW